MKRLLLFILFFSVIVLSLSAGTLKDNGNGTITDETTKLMWQKSDDGIPRTWLNANSYCNELNLGGYDDWRLPTLDELKTIVDKNFIPPSINPIFNCKKTLYWSSSSYENNTNYAWAIHFYYGFAYWRLKSNYNLVRCVRDIKEKILDCSQYKDKNSCENNPDCVPITDFLGNFKGCGYNCKKYTDKSSCESAYEGNACKWISAFGICVNK